MCIFGLEETMLLLDKHIYHLVAEPLGKVRINHLFALFVVEKHVTGNVYVDNIDKPSAFYVVHPYGMSLLFGSDEKESFNSKLLSYLLNREKLRSKHEWLQAYPEAWNSRLESMLNGKLVKVVNLPDSPAFDTVEMHTRVNFKFNRDKYTEFRKSLAICEHEIVRTGRQQFREMQGSVIPSFFWDCEEDFEKHGIGFSLMINDKPASTAYSAFITPGQLELGIETSPEYRGRGYALHTCSALIDHCLSHSFEPVWSCRLENTGSYLLAQKLGFEPTITLPYYKLPV